MAATAVVQPLKYVPWSTAVEVSFWTGLNEKKLTELRLDESEVVVKASFRSGAAQGLGPAIELGSSAFGQKEVTQGRLFRAHGTLINRNTLASFVAEDRAARLKNACSELWASIVSGRAWADPSQLAQFVLLAHADLKKYVYRYQFAFPAIGLPESLTPSLVSNSGIHALSHWLPEGSPQDSLRDAYLRLRNASNGDEASVDCVCLTTLPFHSGSSNSERQVIPLRDLGDHVSWTGEDVALVVADAGSSSEHPSWLLRSALLLIASRLTTPVDLRVVCYRENARTGSIADSLVLTVHVPPVPREAMPGKAVGWEKNSQGKAAVHTANLAETFDPAKLASSAVRLNLELMRWRLMPDLDLERVASTRCLVIGAGTLGCNLARALLGWGVHHMTFVDNGRVSFSNPVRQSLFTYEDSLNGGKPKAVAAADALRRIYPGVHSEGVELSIPMPGHTLGTPAARASAIQAVERLTALLDSHDVVFLGLDSRESRWLPTALAQVAGKLVINVALGFDTYLVMRHGVPDCGDCYAGANALGCYFCNDVVAPRDSLSDRTLDMQCTVTRPGVSMLAAAEAVELMVALLNRPGHPALVPAESAQNLSLRPANGFSTAPHSIRGFLSHFSSVQVASPAYDRCVACSRNIRSELASRGVDFVLQVCNQPECLEEISGAGLPDDGDLLQLIEFDDDLDSF